MQRAEDRGASYDLSETDVSTMHCSLDEIVTAKTGAAAEGTPLAGFKLNVRLEAPDPRKHSSRKR